MQRYTIHLYITNNLYFKSKAKHQPKNEIKTNQATKWLLNLLFPPKKNKKKKGIKKKHKKPNINNSCNKGNKIYTHTFRNNYNLNQF